MKTPPKPPLLILPPPSSLPAPASLQSSSSNSPTLANNNSSFPSLSPSHPPPSSIPPLPTSFFPPTSSSNPPPFSSNIPPSPISPSFSPGFTPLFTSIPAHPAHQPISSSLPPPHRSFPPQPPTFHKSFLTQENIIKIENEPRILLEEMNKLKAELDKEKRANANLTIQKLFDFIDKFGLISVLLLSDIQFIKNIEEILQSSINPSSPPSSPSSPCSSSLFSFLHLLNHKFSFEGEYPSFLKPPSKKKMANLTDRNLFSRLWPIHKKIMILQGFHPSIFHPSSSLLPPSSSSPLSSSSSSSNLLDNEFNRLRALMDRIMEKLILKHTKKKEIEKLFFLYESFLSLEIPECLNKNPLQSLLHKKFYELKNMFIKELGRRIPKFEELKKGITLLSSSIVQPTSSPPNPHFQPPPSSVIHPSFSPISSFQPSSPPPPLSYNSPSSSPPPSYSLPNLPSLSSSFPIDEKVYKILHKHNNLIVHQFFNELDEKKRKITIKDTNLQEEILGIKEGCEVFEFNNLNECLNKLKGMENSRRQPLKIVVKLLFTNHALITNQDSMMKIREKSPNDKIVIRNIEQLKNKELISKTNDIFISNKTSDYFKGNNEIDNAKKFNEHGFNDKVIIRSIEQIPKIRDRILNDKMIVSSMDCISNYSVSSKNDNNPNNSGNISSTPKKMTPKTLTINSFEAIVKPSSFHSYKNEKSQLNNKSTPQNKSVSSDFQNTIKNFVGGSKIMLNNSQNIAPQLNISNPQILLNATTTNNLIEDHNKKNNNNIIKDKNNNNINNNDENPKNNGLNIPFDSNVNEWMKCNLKDEGQKRTMIKIKKKIDPKEKNELSIFNKEIENLISQLVNSGINPVSVLHFDGKVLMKFNDHEERKKAFGIISAVPKERLGRKGLTLRCYSGIFKIKEF